MQLDLNLCLGCMEPIGGDAVCPYCGYTAGSPYLVSYLAPGTVLNDRYLVGKLLHYNGESGFYIGYDEAESTKIFIKEYMPDTLCRRIKDSPIVAVNQDAVAQYKTFMSEFVELNKGLARLRNSGHINPAIDMFGANNTGYVIFDHISGITLSDFLRRNGGILPWESVKNMFTPLFTTLSLVHNAGLVHRGICPDNLVVTNSGEVVLMGFAIPDERTSGTKLNAEIYNGYAAPEQYSSGKWQGTQTDVYGISALLYRMLTGAVPQDAAERTANDNLMEPSALNSEIPPRVSGVIMKGLALDSDTRIHTMTELVTELFDEPEQQRSANRTQTISIPIQHIDDDGEDNAEGFGRQNYYERPEPHTSSARNKKQFPSRHKVFIAASLISAVVLIILMAVIMMVLNDSRDGSSRKINVTSDTLADIDDIDNSLTHQTVSEEGTDDSNQPTLNEVEQTETTTQSSGNFYIMNDLIGKNYETIKNSPTYAGLVFDPQYEFNEENAKGTIFEQSIASGEKYSEGTQITIKVSLGSRYVTVPDWIGVKASDYFNLLEGKNIKYEQVSYETSDYADGYVCGISVDEDTVLDLEESEALIVYVAYNPVTETEETTTEEEVTETEQETETETETEFETEPAEETTEEEYPDDGEINIDDPNYDEEQVFSDDEYIY